MAFYQECLDERQAKVGKFANYLRGVAHKYGEDKGRMMEAIKSSKCKVPWSNQ